MEFDEFQSVCMHHGCAYDIDKQVIDVCKNPETQNPGKSWSVCDRANCPLYGKSKRKEVK